MQLHHSILLPTYAFDMHMFWFLSVCVSDHKVIAKINKGKTVKPQTPSHHETNWLLPAFMVQFGQVTSVVFIDDHDAVEVVRSEC